MSPDGTVPAGKPWLDSSAVRYLLGSALGIVLTWVGDAVVRNAWDWRSLVLSLLPVLGFVVKRLMDPDVVAPLDALNASNPRRVP